MVSLYLFCSIEEVFYLIDRKSIFGITYSLNVDFGLEGLNLSLDHDKM